MIRIAQKSAAKLQISSGLCKFLCSNIITIHRREISAHRHFQRFELPNYRILHKRQRPHQFPVNILVLSRQVFNGILIINTFYGIGL